MAKSLVIVESPAKAKTINKFLGRDYLVKASMGHVRDLPVKSLAVDVDHDFKPKYEVVRGREKVLSELKTAAKSSAAVYLAADPDREGEAICWHLAQELKSARKPVHRVMFNEITKRAVQEAFAHPGRIDQRKVDAQQARRILDRLVGYKISPLLWEKVRRGISAGRVQSVALRLVADREKEIRAFTPTEYWTIAAELARPDGVGSAFPARLSRVDGEKASIPSQQDADRILAELTAPGTEFRVASLVKKEKRRNPVPPFTTSKLQQEAARKLHFPVRKTMQVAQQLYEGIEVGDAGAVGLITYMRTDSTRISPEAQAEVRQFIADRYGAAFLPDRPPTYRSGKGAQEAHEAIRPTSVLRDPAQMAPYLTREQLALYTLIWNRFVASQMRPAVFDATSVDIAAGRCTFRASGQQMKFAGFMQVYVEGRDEAARGAPEEPEAEGDEERSLPPLQDGQALDCRALTPAQHFTQPPPRFTEASLVKELEERGIGRPSTYAAILSVIQNRDYVVKDEGKFKPTELGEIVVDLLVESFPRILDPGFTAQMETKLDEIEEGTADWLEAMHKFYGAFAKWLEKARSKMRNVKAMEEPSDQVCEKCGRPMVIKWGRFGKFLACSGYPECKSTKELPGNGNGESAAGTNGQGGTVGEGQPCENCGKPMVLKRGRFGPFLACSGYPECRTVVRIARSAAPPPQPTDQVCEQCGAPMVIRQGRFGPFYSCSTYPACKNLKPIPIGVDCPQCGAPLTARRTKRGRTFYGCSAYPKCEYTLWDRPIPEPCPRCGAKFLVEKRSKAGVKIRCIQEGCDYARDVEPEAQTTGEAPASGDGAPVSDVPASQG
ncbi:MAG TPA: type I DNA topoisomerase [Candidatus Methylomirabilis sp.]|nr:type I DNA topoisomerase [Candidatus Methylomirabilis sp.]